MLYYIYGDYVYINKIYNAPEEHNIYSILKTHSDLYLTSFLKLMDESLQYLTKLFICKMIKNLMFEYVNLCHSCKIL